MKNRIPQYIQGFVGQQKAIRTLNFLINAQRTTGVLNGLLLFSEKSGGKTHLARTIASNLVGKDKRPKTIIEINGATIRKKETLINQILIPHCVDNDVTIIFDEAHAIDPNVLPVFLSVIQPNREHIAKLEDQGNEILFNYRYSFSVMFLTTNIEKLPTPLINRLEKIELVSYKPNELIQILKLNSGEVQYKDGVEKEMITTTRSSPRIVVRLAEKVISYCEQVGSYCFGINEWKELSRILDIQEIGLEPMEINLLKYLYKAGPQSLTSISSRLGVDTSTIRRRVESYLLGHGLIQIDGKRHITSYGQKLLKKIIDTEEKE